MDDPEAPNPKNSVRDLVEGGADLAGAAVGGALGFLLAGPLGAAAAGAGGVAITKIFRTAGLEIYERILSPREKVRVGCAIAVAADRTRERLASGDFPRDDEYINDGTDRPPAEENSEGLLIAAQRAYDEKKVAHIGYLMANLNFDKDMQVEAASVLVRISDQLNYQQLCLIKLCDDNARAQLVLSGKYIKNFKNSAHAAILADLFELERNGLINNGGTAVLGLSDIDPMKVRHQGFGTYLFRLMELHRIPDDDIRPLIDHLNAPDIEYIVSQPPEKDAAFIIGSEESPLTAGSSILTKQTVSVKHSPATGAEAVSASLLSPR